MATPRQSSYYRERGWHFLTLVDDQLDKGELEVACEMLWGAAAHAIKSEAQRRGWEHGAHALLSVAVERLVTEVGAPPYLSGQYKIASDFHIGFYGDLVFNAGNIRAGKELISEFVQTMESLA